jgi:hypothetical protein
MSNSPDDTAGVTVTDPDGFNTDQRLKQIYRAREDLRKMRKQAAQIRNNPNTDSHAKVEAVQHYRAAVESLLLEVGTLLKNHDPGPELWANRHYGDVVIRPPGNWEPQQAHYKSQTIERNNTPLLVEEIPDAKRVPVVGLRWLFETETPVTRPFEFKIYKGALNETVTYHSSSVVPWRILNQMVSEVNEYLNEVGVGLEVVEESDDVAEMDYTDLI